MTVRLSLRGRVGIHALIPHILIELLPLCRDRRTGRLLSFLFDARMAGYYLHRNLGHLMIFMRT